MAVAIGVDVGGTKILGIALEDTGRRVGVEVRRATPHGASALLDTMGETWELDDELVPIELVDRIAMPMGVLEVADALTRIDCPIAPELFKSVDPL